jgi:hypothetical protein
VSLNIQGIQWNEFLHPESQLLTGSPEVQLAVTLVIGILGAVAMLILEKLAIALIGAIAGGGLTQAAGPLLVSFGEMEWYWPFIGAFFGAMIFPLAFKRIIPIATSLIGSLCTSWAFGEGDNLPLIVGLTLLGSGLQMIFLRKARHFEE